MLKRTDILTFPVAEPAFPLQLEQPTVSEIQPRLGPSGTMCSQAGGMRFGSVARKSERWSGGGNGASQAYSCGGPFACLADGCLAVGCCFMASLVVEAYLRRFVRPSHAQGRDYIHMYIYTICSCRAHTHILYFRRWETSRVPRSLCGWTTKTRNRVKIYVLYMKIETNEKADSKSKGKTAGWHLFTFFGCWFSYFHSLPPSLAVAARCRWISLLAVELWELLVAVVSSHFLLLLGFASSIATSLSFGVLASWRLFPCYFVGFFIFLLVLFWSD